MKLYLHTALLLIFCSPPALGQVNTTVGNYRTKLSRAIPLKRPFVGTFHFESLPQPLKPCRVDFTLEVNENTYPVTQGNWDIRIIHEPKVMQLLSDTVLIWSEPHNMGDLFSGTVEFIPLESGYHGFSVALRVFEEAGLNVKYCLTPDGELEYLGNPKDVSPDCFPLRTTFFSADSIHMKHLTGAMDRPSSIFAYSITITPPLKMGDTSTVLYRFRALHDLPSGVDLQLNVQCFEVVSLPKPLDYAVFRDQEIELSLLVVPKEVRDEHLILVEVHWYSNDTGRRMIHRIAFEALFWDNGTLRYITNRAFGRETVLLSPQSFRAHDYSKDFKKYFLNGGK